MRKCMLKHYKSIRLYFQFAITLRNMCLFFQTIFFILVTRIFTNNMRKCIWMHITVSVQRHNSKHQNDMQFVSAARSPITLSAMCRLLSAFELSLLLSVRATTHVIVRQMYCLCIFLYNLKVPTRIGQVC